MCAVVKRETCFHSLRALVIEKNYLSMNHELTRIVTLLVIKIIGMPNAITNCQTLTAIELRMLVAGWVTVPGMMFLFYFMIICYMHNNPAYASLRALQQYYVWIIDPNWLHNCDMLHISLTATFCQTCAVQLYKIVFQSIRCHAAAFGNSIVSWQIAPGCTQTFGEEFLRFGSPPDVRCTYSYIRILTPGFLQFNMFNSESSFLQIKSYHLKWGLCWCNSWCSIHDIWLSFRDGLDSTHMIQG